ncbi:MAG: DNA-directed RNA polymerase subunit omega [Bryobacter sp.]|jgi:DNA-directed RNA polymerase subunit omega|nr:DNA-directed RNA polymerase subunit omega [Bryobacter sp. CoA8 C33]
MAENKGGSRVNAHYIIPDDPENSTYRFIIVSAKRARQIQGGQRSFLPTMSRKPTVVAMEETRRGLVQYHIPGIPEAGAEDAL